MIDNRTDQERHDDFINMYRKSGGFRQDGERLWEKHELERSAPELKAENERLQALLEEKVLLFDAEREVISLRRQHITRWRDRDEHYWNERLMQEVGELASVLANDHDDSVEWELRQIASICINWLEMRTAPAQEGDLSRPATIE